MTTLTDFLLARIAEDEAVARQASGPSWWQRDREDGYFFVASESKAVASAPYAEDRAHIARHDPARVLVECEAKRRIVEECRESEILSAEGTNGLVLARSTMRLLALPYAGHPNYDESWRD